MNQVSTLSMISMGFSLIMSAVLPIGLFIVLRRRFGADRMPFFTGIAVMLMFAFGLEQIVHRLVLGSAAGTVIQQTPVLYALYGGLMAGLFEETGRLLAFRTVLRNSFKKDVNALMYGAGHGGIECLIILGITNLNNLLFSVMINSGRTSKLTENLSGSMLSQMESSIALLCTASPALFLGGLLERMIAMALHLALSVLVYIAVKHHKTALFSLAIAGHALVDAGSAYASLTGVPAFVIETGIAFATCIICLLAGRIWICEGCVLKTERT